MRTTKLFLQIVVASIATFSAFAQPSNDNCAGAISLGTLPTPGACVSGLQNGTATTLTNQTTVGATAASPYVYQTGCVGGGNMQTFALDTWYSFTASGTTANINITGFPNANVALYSGSCANLLGRGCTILPSGGSGTLTVAQITTGQTYYVQISGNTTTATDASFSIAIDNDIDCNDCLLNSSITASPAPVNGGYQPGQAVQFCYTVNGWSQQNTNWFHGVQISMGPGWTGAITSAVPAATEQNIAGPGFDGAWYYYPAGIGGGYGTGFYFETVVNGTAPGNNYGDNCNGTGCSWTFCWTQTVSASCTPGTSLSVTVNTSGDGESGSWTSSACTDDPATVFTAIQICCTAPTMTSTAVTCIGGTNGSVTATHGTGSSPWDYVWTNSSGTVVGTTNNSAAASNTVSNLPAGNYVVTITDNNNCVTSNNVTVGPGINCTCLINNFTTNIGFCQPNNTFPVSGTFVYSNAPSTGTLVVEVTTATGTYTQTFNPPFVNGTTYNYNITNAISDGSASTVEVYFTADLACTQLINFTAPAACLCSAEIGTYTADILGVSNNNYVLCYGDIIDIQTNNDWTAPGIANNPPGPAYDPGVSWLIFSCPPTVGLTPSATQDVANDPCLLGLVSDFDLNDLNDMAIINSFPPGTFTNNIVYYVPITMYSISSSTYSYVNTSIPCYELGTPYAVQYLPQIITSTTQTCTNVTATITGGLPAVNGSQFTAVAGSLIPATASFVNTTANNGGTIAITGLTSGQAFSFQVQDANGCPVTISGTFVGPPVLTYPQTAYCQNAANPSPTITGAAGGTYSSTAGLSINSSTGVVNLGASTVGTYVVTYTTPAVPGPACSATFTITINPLPIIAVPNQAVCAGTAVTLSGNGANTYTWTGGITNGVAFTPASTTTYTVTGTITATGCTNTDPATITVNPIPTVNAGANQTVCNGTNVTLSGSGTATTYTWSPAVTNGLAFLPPASTTTTYTVTGTLSGCTNTATVNVTSNPLPVVGTTNVSICTGGTVALNASGATTYSWSPATYLSATTGASVNFVNGVTTTYTVTGTLNGCVSSSPLTVTVTPSAPINAGPDITICAGTTTPITASGGVSYTWSPATYLSATTGATVTYTAGTTTTYTVTGTDASGCIGSDQMVVTVNPLPTATIAGTATVCQGAAAQTITFTGAGAIAPYTFTYTINGGANQTVTTSVGNSVTVSAPTGTTGTFTYALVSVASANTCSQTQVGNAVVTITPLPTATISGTTTLCQNAASPNITFTGAGGTAPYTFTYTINGGANQTVTTSAGNSVTVAAPTGTVGTFTYSLVSVASANGCSQTQAGTATVTISPLPTVTITGTTAVCQNSPNPSITFTGAGGTAPYTFTYNINGGANQTVTTSAGNSVTVSAPTTTVGSYAYNLVSVLSANTCSQAQAGTATVTVNALPSPIINGAATYCAGQSSTLSTSIPFTTYSWTTGVSTPTTNVTIANNPISVTVTNAQGCSATSPTFTVSENTVITYNSAVSICQGQSVLIHGVSQSTAGTYSQTYVLGTGCDSTSNVTLTVNPLPVINVPDQTVCAGTAVTLSGNGANTYTWTGGITNGTPFTPAATTTYTVTGTNTATGCTNTDQATITLNPLPTATISGTITVCQNTANPTITFTGSNGTAPYTFTYNINGGANQTVTSVGNTATVSAPTATVGSFTYSLVSVQDASSTACSQAQVGSATITVNPLPTAIIAGTTTVCLNAASPNVTFTGANGTAPYTFTYNINGGANQTVSTSAGNSVTVAASTATAGTFTYSLVSVSSSNGCSQVQVGSVTITISPLPTATISGTTAVCQNTASPSITFTGANSIAPYTFTYNINGGANQTVSTAGGSSSATVSAPTSAAGTFTYNLVSVVSSTTCSQAQSGSAVITVNPLPTATISGTAAVCINGTAPTVILTGASGTAPYTFTYNINGGANQTATSVGNNATITAPTGTAGTFTYNLVSVSYAMGCSQNQVGSAIITVNPLPVVNAGNDFSICENETAILTASGANTYSWNNGVSNGVSFTPPLGTTTYTVIGTSAIGCTDTDNITITVNPTPVVSFVPDVTIGCAPLTVNFTNTTPNSSNCVWSLSNGSVLTGCGTVTTTFMQPGCYDVTLTTTSNGCVGTFTALDIVCVEGVPNAAFTASNNFINEFDPSVSFTNNSTGASSYVWNFGDNTPTSSEENTDHDYSGSEIGNYVVTLIAYSPFGCSDTAIATIQMQEQLIFYVPNTFTPDDDKYNPVFKPIFTAGYDPFNYTLLIFNRWGEIIFESHDTEVGWDGSYGSNREINMVQDGTYTWKIEFKTTANDERKMVVGHVNVIR